MPHSDHPLSEYLSPLTTAWQSKFRRAEKAKSTFDDVARQCRVFFKGTDDFWADENKGGCYGKYMDASMRPKFRMTMSKAFELVALFGPMLFFRNPQRHVAGRKGVDVIPEIFPLPPGVPPEQSQQVQAQQMQQVQMQQKQKQKVDDVRAQVLEKVLNYMPVEQPGNGLYAHGRRAIQEALITGRGCLWPELYQPAGSQTKLVGSFYDTVDNLLIDPGCMRPDMSDAYWISKKVQEPAWKLEREYGLRAGSLEGHKESTEALSEANANTKQQDRRDGKTKDLVTYYKVWSKTGIGYRFNSQKEQVGLQNEYLKQIDEAVGDYAFMVIVPGVPYPINMPPERLAEAQEEDVRAAFAWPVEHWRDGAWPVKVIDFYEDEAGPWPIAPLRPAMGAIVFVNLMLSTLAERGVEGTKDIIGVLKTKYDDLTSALAKGGTRVVVPLDGVNTSLNEVMNVWQSNPVNFDVWRIIDAVMHEIERMTGLTDFLQGMQQTQDRSAASSQAKQQQMQLRPDDMAGQVEKWQQRVAAGERLTLHRYVTGQDLHLLLGDYGAWVWDTYVTTQPIESVLRETDVTIEPGSVRKPNKSQEAENIQNFSQVVLPMFQQVYAGTGNAGPLNAWIKRMARSIDLEGDDLFIPPPPPPPEEQQQQQPDPAVQVEQMKAQAAQAQTQMKMQAAQQKHQMDMQKMGAQTQAAQMDLQIDQLSARSRMEEEQMQAELNRQEMMMRLKQLQMESRTRKQQAT